MPPQDAFFRCVTSSHIFPEGGWTTRAVGHSLSFPEAGWTTRAVRHSPSFPEVVVELPAARHSPSFPEVVVELPELYKALSALYVCYVKPHLSRRLLFRRFFKGVPPCSCYTPCTAAHPIYFRKVLWEAELARGTSWATAATPEDEALKTTTGQGLAWRKIKTKSQITKEQAQDGPKSHQRTSHKMAQRATKEQVTKWPKEPRGNNKMAQGATNATVRPDGRHVLDRDVVLRKTQPCAMDKWKKLRWIGCKQSVRPQTFHERAYCSRPGRQVWVLVEKIWTYLLQVFLQRFKFRTVFQKFPGTTTSCLCPANRKNK